jgi:hypothetical protein
MKPMVHARISAKKFGGIAEDYLAIHDFMDCTKMALPDVRHRMMLHNSVGCFIAERVFGHTITNSENKTVHVRDVAEAHIIEDLGFIPTLEKCFSGMAIEAWMSGGVHKHKEESKPQPIESPKATEPAVYDGFPHPPRGTTLTSLPPLPDSWNVRV